MPAPVRLQALTLPVSDLAAVARFARWVLGLKAAPDDAAEGEAAGERLFWGHEDRIWFVDGEAPGAAEALTLRMPAQSPADAAAWLEERGLAPATVRVGPKDADEAARLWPDAEVVAEADETAANRVVATIRAPGGLRVELFFPLPKEVLVPRNQMGPFTWRSGDRSDLEIPGLLGVTTGAPDPAALRAFAEKLGLAPMDAGDERAPLAVGDHQWIVEEREIGGIHGYAVVVRASRVKDLARTLEHLEAEHRLDGNRIAAIDPAGRLLVVHGVRGG